MSKNLKHLAPFEFYVSDSGDESTGWPSISSNDDADTSIIGWRGFTEHFNGLNQKQAVQMAKLIVDLLNKHYEQNN